MARLMVRHSSARLLLMEGLKACQMTTNLSRPMEGLKARQMA